MKETAEKTGIIVLAAGASSRMKTPKQLLDFEGETLLRRAVSAAVESICEPVVVVLGANYEKTSAEIEDLPVEICFNERWENGLSSSIKTGIERLLKIEPEISAAVFTLADQPLVNGNHINLLVEKFHRSKNSIIAAEYNETVGVPAVFARKFFDDFFELSGDTGAKIIMEKRRESLETIELPEAAFDIDTERDFLNLKTGIFDGNA